ncbi:MAG: hypothetical protein ABIO70_08165 [Pseudomonadota bacterium]
MAFALLFALACAPESSERVPIEYGARVEEPAAEPWIEDARVYCDQGWWRMHVNVVGIAPSAEWVIDLVGPGEPHRMVADGWSAETRHQEWTNESPCTEDKVFQVESAIPCDVGMNHLIWLQGEASRVADCAVLGPEAEGIAPGILPDTTCAALTYDDSWSIDG